MSWKDNIKNIFYIRTGDGRTYASQGTNTKYSMHLLGSVKSTNFNTEGFNFINIEGTFVAREKPQGSQYPITFYFEGENHIEVTKEFEISARDKNSWLIGHPIWGEIICQPLNMEIDSSFINTTKITVTVWETIEQKYPNEKYNEKNQIEIKLAKLSTSYFLISLSSGISETTKATAFSLTDLIDIEFSMMPATNEQLVDLKNKVRAVSSAIEEILTQPERFMDSLYSLLTFVIEVEDNIVSKIKKLGTIFDKFKNLNDVSIFEPTATAIITIACEASVNSLFKKRSDVLEVITDIDTMYSDTNTFYEENNIVPNYEMSLDLDFIKSVTLGNLYTIGMNASQERFMILEQDSNPVNLAHRFYGFSDESLERFIDENNISIKEMFNVKKGRRITWYV